MVTLSGAFMVRDKDVRQIGGPTEATKCAATTKGRTGGGISLSFSAELSIR